MSNSHPSSSSDLESILRKLSNEQLIGLVIRAVSLAPEIRPLFTQSPDDKDPSDLVDDARDAISTAVEDVDWEEWHHSGTLVDYAPVFQSFQVLQLSGFSAEVLELALELIEESKDQIEQYDRGGEIVDEILPCMNVVLEAFNTVDWPNYKKMLWLLDAQRDDIFSLTESFRQILNNPHPQEDWSLVADALLKRIPDDERTINETVGALTRAGRDSEAVEFRKTVAINDGDYLSLVRLLLEKKNYPEAEEWIHKGMAVHEAATPRNVERLRECLLELRIGQEAWDEALFMQTEDFVQNPSLERFKSCQHSAKKLNNWQTVRSWLLDFLTESKKPWDQDTWPFPNKGKAAPARDQGKPNFELLIDMAIYEKNPADVLKWYDLKPRARSYSSYGRHRIHRQIQAVANAVQDFAPERSIGIWKELAEEEIAVTQAAAYEEAGRHLGKLKAIMSQNNMSTQWNDYIQSLRTKYKRRPRLIKVLDRLLQT